MVIPGHNLGNSQVSVNRTIGPTLVQSFWNGATASVVFTSTLGAIKCLAQGHYTAVVGFEPGTSRSEVRSSSTTESKRPPTYRHCELTDTQKLFKLAQLRWAGHVTRMPKEQLPKKFQKRKRSQCGQKNRYKVILKRSLKVSVLIFSP